jgi:hypothetical protein
LRRFVPFTKKKLAAQAAVMRVNYIYGCSADLLSIVLIKKPMIFLLQSMIISQSAPTRHIAAKLSVRAAIHRDDRPGSGHLFYQIRP